MVTKKGSTGAIKKQGAKFKKGE